MKKVKALMIAGVLAALVFGCSTTNQTENMLTTAGFKMIPADTPEKLAHLQSLPAEKLTKVTRSGTAYYTYADKPNKMLYVGEQAQYQEYQKLRLQQQKQTEEDMDASAMTGDAGWSAWGEWGGGGWRQ